MVLALLATTTAFYVGMRPLDGNASRAGVWAMAALGPLGCLLVAVAALANRRFFSAQDIDAAAGGPASASARMIQAVIQNTLEQGVLALGVYAVLALLAPASVLALPLFMSAAFVLGRAAFAAGYARGAAGRAFGFGLTFYPTVGGFLYAASLALQGRS